MSEATVVVLAGLFLLGLNLTLWGGVGVIRWLVDTLDRWRCYWISRTFLLMLGGLLFTLLALAATPLKRGLFAPLLEWFPSLNQYYLFEQIWLCLICYISSVFIYSCTRSKHWTHFSMLFLSALYLIFYAPSFLGNQVQLLDHSLFLAIHFLIGQLCASLAIRRGQRHTRVQQRRTLRAEDIAIIIPAHNEEASIGRCLENLCTIVAPHQVYVGSDASTDKTAEIVRSYGCNITEFFPNIGKARVLRQLMVRNNLLSRYQAITILDADSEIDPQYMHKAVDLFNSNPEISAIAGHVVSKWYLPKGLSAAMMYVSYRVRLYRLTQAFLRYGQTWRHTNVTFIIPGFASTYRTDILDQIDVDAEGLIIEDFNMTFEVHRKRLGHIAYSPQIRCTSQDPGCLTDYVKQIKRWYLGFWQTVLRHGFWASLFSASLLLYLFEMLTFSFFYLLILLYALLALLGFVPSELALFQYFGLGVGLGVDIDVFHMAVSLAAIDYGITILIAVIEKRPSMLLYGLGYPFIRIFDAALFLYTLPLSMVTKSNGIWSSPKRA